MVWLLSKLHWNTPLYREISEAYMDAPYNARAEARAIRKIVEATGNGFELRPKKNRK
jgi:hypothetical protein